MNILIAPDSHKGGPSATLVAETIATAWREVRPADGIQCIPIADGGEGTAGILALATGGMTISITAPGPLGDAIQTDWVVLGDGKTAVIELARTSGLALVPESSRNPAVTSTRGMGVAILSAIEHGATDLILTVGGSSSNDGGAGLAAALGFQLTDDAARPVPDGAIGIASATRLQIAPHASLERVRTVRVAVDVQNPLTGPNGAAAVFGPQKGASQEDIAVLDQCMERWLELTGLESFPGAGAAGGTPIGIKLVFPNATFAPGITLVLDTCGFDDAVKTADLVITSEGCFDDQTLMGKAISGIAARAESAGVPVVVIAGMVKTKQTPAAIRHVEPSTIVPTDDVAERISNLREATRRVAMDIDAILNR
ncbi:MAG: glycerate kinase [Armatimonadota bacterium]